MIRKHNSFLCGGILVAAVCFLLVQGAAWAAPARGAERALPASPARGDEPNPAGGVPFGGVRVAEAEGGAVVTVPAAAGFLVRWPDGARAGRGGRLVLDVIHGTAPEAGVVRGVGPVRLIRYVQMPGLPPVVRVVLDLAEDAPWTVVPVPGAVRVAVGAVGTGDPVVLLGSTVADAVYEVGPEGAEAAAEAGSLSGRVVVLDPGHGGADPGAVGLRGTLEKDLVLAVSRRLRDLLLAKGARVVMTRADDLAVGLYERAALARSAGADLFLSVHANWSWGKSIRGVEAYYYPGGAGGRLAELAVRHLAARLGAPGRGALPADFVVLRETPAPAALVEVGFLSHPAEEALLRDRRYQDEVAAALAAAVEEFLAAPGGERAAVSASGRL